MKKAVFFDKDGTLIPDLQYNTETTRIRLVDGAMDVLKELSRSDYIFIVVTNQQAIAKGLISEQQIQEVRNRLVELFELAGVTLTGFFYCPHDPKGIIVPYNIECNCRKPLPGMIIQAATEYDIDLSNSWMVGDILDDIEAGNRAGCKTILIGNGNETEWLRADYRTPDFTVKTIGEISEIITSDNLIESPVNI